MLAADNLLATYFPLYQNGGGHSAACLALCEHMRGEGLEVEMHCPAAGQGGSRTFTRAAMPNGSGALPTVSTRAFLIAFFADAIGDVLNALTEPTSGPRRRKRSMAT